ncbi:MAG: hypothetical protein MJK04_34555, partial [Psychrosphaera sp.]|nr:hypothetical protein [Psychrosphaera sp.]
MVKPLPDFIKNYAFILPLVIAMVVMFLVLGNYTPVINTYICDSPVCGASQVTASGKSVTKDIDYFKQLSHVPTRFEFTDLQYCSGNGKQECSLTLGQEALYAFDADPKHLKIIKDKDAVFIQNISYASALPIYINGRKSYPRQYTLKSADVVV